MDILFVDDNEQITELMDAFFTSLGYFFKVVTTSEEAIELVKHFNFKVIVLDINLGYTNLNGVELCLLFRKHNKTSKIYALTAYSELFHDIAPDVAGFDGAFFKPSGYKDLLFQLKKDLKIISD